MDKSKKEIMVKLISEGNIDDALNLVGIEDKQQLMNEEACENIGGLLCGKYGSMILSMTYKFERKGTYSSIRFLEFMGIIIRKQETFHEDRKRILSNEKRRFSMVLSFTVLTLGFASNVISLFELFNHALNSELSSLTVFNFNSMRNNYPRFLDLMPIVISVSIFPLGYNRLGDGRQILIGSLILIILRYLLLYFLGTIIGNQIFKM